ncbi:MAG: hypothetical protein LBE91_09240 [Tannerella sp.]|jgi:hypothetical protein|nr:hypothetical protein [Tannerella sp.]
MRKSTKILLFSVFTLFFCFSAELRAENLETGLRIDEVFRRFGRARSVTMVELSQEMLEMYNMRLYKSISIRNNPEALQFIRESLEEDRQGARTIKEITDEGGIISAYYQLPATDEGLNRFILFNVNRQNLKTLVYIEGDLNSEDLITLLFSLKQN